MPSFNCKDLGMDCEWSIDAKNQDNLMKKIASHAKSHHNINKIDDDMMKKVMNVIKP